MHASRLLTVLLALALFASPFGLASAAESASTTVLAIASEPASATSITLTANLAGTANLASATVPDRAPSPSDVFFSAAQARPAVIAHRGGSGLAPDNTLPAIQKAYDLGADGVEFDVQLTADGQLVICHDYYVDAYSDGSGLIAEKTLAELRELDFGSWYGPEFAGTRILTLAEALEASAGFSIVDVELKAPLSRNPAYASLVAQAIEDSGLGEKVVVSSFDHELLGEFKACAPDIKVAALVLPGLFGELGHTSAC